jgi:hypothetical protein
MGEIKSRLKWVNKVASGSRLTEAGSDAELIKCEVDKVQKLFNEKVNSANTAVWLFRDSLKQVKIKADNYKASKLWNPELKNPEIEDPEILKRQLRVSCKAALDKLKKIEEAFENL